MFDDINFTNKSVKIKKNLLIGLLVLVVLVSWSYIIWDKSNNSQRFNDVASSIKNTAVSKLDSLRAHFIFTEHKLDSINTVNNSLQGEKLIFDDTLLNIRKETRLLLANNDLSGNDIAKAQALLATLYNYSTTLELDLKQLRGQKKTLEKEIGIAQSSNLQLKKEIEKKKTETKTLTNHLKNTIIYTVDNFEATAIKLKSDGTEKSTLYAKSTDKLNISYNIIKNTSNNIGSNDFYIIVLDDKNELVLDKNQKMGVFETKLEGTKLYTKKITVHNIQKMDKISVDIEAEKGFKIGDYNILIYNNGFKIGDYYKKLKKRSLI